MSGVVGFIHPSTGKQCMLEINQAVHAPKAEVNLLSPMQCELNDVKINAKAKFLCRNPTEKSHKDSSGAS